MKGKISWSSFTAQIYIILWKPLLHGQERVYLGFTKTAPQDRTGQRDPEEPFGVTYIDILLAMEELFSLY